MKKATFLALVLVLVGSASLRSQSLQERLEKFGTAYAQGYMSPFVDAFGASLNSGWYNTANLEDGLSLFVGVKVMLMPIPDDHKMFRINSPYNNSIVDETPTAFGPNVETPISGAPPGASPDKYAPGFDLPLAAMAMPQVSIGNMYGTRATLRFFPATKLGDIGDFSMFGLGVQHSISRYLPNPLPVDLAGMFAFQSLKVGSVVEASSFMFGVQASKSFPVVDVYAGLGYETSSMTIGYDATYTDPMNPSNTITQHIGFDADGSNTVRFTGGISLSLLIFKIHADYSIASQPVATLGIGLGW